MVKRAETLDHVCEHKGCGSVAIECRLPADDEDNAAVEWLCPEHASEAGYCHICGDFWAGIESFDLGDGVCEHCHAELDEDDPDDEDDWNDELSDEG